MRLIRIILLLLVVTAGTSWSLARQRHLGDDVKFGQHPRLLMLDEDIPAIRKNIADNTLWNKVDRNIRDDARMMLSADVVERQLTGRRLLSVSRTALRRIFYMAYVYRVWGDTAMLRRAEREMLAIARMTDWNPSHFLDVAEMTMAMAIGYDWLYSGLGEESRAIIRDAIISKGIDPSLDESANTNWLTSTNNWNQVCHCGISYGAMAVAEDIPQLARIVVDRAIDAIALPMKEYAPDGSYPEGFSYWSYGTNFNVLFISALERICGTDYGLSETPGFLSSAYFIENMIGPTKWGYNYGDSDNTRFLSPTIFWMADKLRDTSVLWSQKYYLETMPADHRTLPALMVWGKDLDLSDVRPPQRRLWVGQGVTPVGSMRSSWGDSDAIFVGFKTGRASMNHAHMDIGSFVMEAGNVRWAIDLGPQEYNSLESKGIDLWNRRQDSRRWDIYRYNNFAHNTLTVNGARQDVNGYASIGTCGETPGFIFMTSDLTPAYNGQLAACRRGIAIVNDSHVVVQDEIEAADKPADITWTMLTRAKVRKTGKNSLELTQDGRRLRLEVDSDSRIVMSCSPAQPVNSYDAPNPGVTLVRFTSVVPAARCATYCVRLIPENNKSNYKPVPLSQWK